MAGKVAEASLIYAVDDTAKQIAYLWDMHNTQRGPWLDQKLELRNYVFATDTSTTTNSTLPWKNSTTIPKLCQIRDNLHANYASALFPNDNWFKWEGADLSAEMYEKKQAITAYVQNKTQFGGFRNEIYKLLYDYIDYGNAFYDVDYYNESTTTPEGEVIPGYIGAKIRRISPNDIVFNAAADNFDDTYKIVRSLKSMGDLINESINMSVPWADPEKLAMVQETHNVLSQLGVDDMRKFQAFNIDGFGTMYEYFQSGYVELLEFEGSFYNPNTREYLHNYRIIVADRSIVLYMAPIDTWTGKSLKGHVGWRMRPDNLYGMGPLDNLVGMQYRIDHLENLKADAMDMAVQPPLFISGNVEEFEWGPSVEINGGQGASITELGKSLNGVIQADNNIAMLEAKMEEMAGAPKQAMGIRTPGEKTAFEVQTLEMAASRIFQNKIQHFEISLIEPALNKILEVSRRKLDSYDLIRVMDNDVGIVGFMQVTKEDITASGKLRAIGARHFSINATIMQNLAGLQNSGITQDPLIMNHISPKAMAKMVEQLLGVERFGVFKENARIYEAAEAEQVAQTAQQYVQEITATPLGVEEETPQQQQLPQPPVQ